MKVIFENIKDESKNMNDFKDLYTSSIKELTNLTEKIESESSGKSFKKLLHIVEDLIESHGEMIKEAEDHKKSLNNYIKKVLDTKKVTPINVNEVTKVEPYLLRTKIDIIQTMYYNSLSDIHKIDKPNKAAVSRSLDKETRKELYDYIDKVNKNLDNKKKAIKIEEKKLGEPISDIKNLIEDIYGFEYDDIQRKRRENHFTAKIVGVVGVAVVATVTFEFWGPAVLSIATEAGAISLSSRIFIKATTNLNKISVAASKGKGKAWKSVKEVSKIKVGDASIGSISMKITALNILNSAFKEDSYFSLKEVLTDILLEFGNKKIGKFTFDKTKNKLGGIFAEKVSKKTIAASIDDYLDYDTEVYHQISELEKSLEDLGVL